MTEMQISAMSRPLSTVVSFSTDIGLVIVRSFSPGPNGRDHVVAAKK